MISLLALMRRVIAALWHVGRTRTAPAVWHAYALWTSRLVRVALLIIIGHSALVTLVSLAGVHELTVVVSLLTVVALAVILVIASLPRFQDELATALAIGGGLSLWNRTREIFEAIFRGLFFFLLLDAAFGLYFSLVPVENQRGLVLWIIFFGVIFALAVAVQKAERRKKITNAVVFLLLVGSAAAVFILIPLALFNGGVEETKKDIAKAFEDNAKAAPAEVIRTPEEAATQQIRIEMPPDGGPSRAITIRAGWRYNFLSAPLGTQACFTDKTCGPLTQEWGMRSGLVWFVRSGGGQVILQAIPPQNY